MYCLRPRNEKIEKGEGKREMRKKRTRESRRARRRIEGKNQLTSALNALTASISMKVRSTKDLLCFTGIRDSRDVQCFRDKSHVFAQSALSSWAMPLKMATLFPERHRGAVMRDVTCRRCAQSVTIYALIPIVFHQSKSS